LFSVKFDKDNLNNVMSGGWDNRIIFWDIREENPIKVINDPNLCGDAMDNSDGLLVTGSHREKKQIEIWDINTCKMIMGDLSWETPNCPTVSDPCKLNCCSFNKGSYNYIMAGGSKGNEAKLFQFKGKHMATWTGFSKEVRTIDFNETNEMVCISGADGFVRVFNVSLP
jgi:COMPASS component SWD3